MAPLRIGFIGAGDNTRKMHIPGFKALDDIELVSVVNRSSESSQQVADEFGIAKTAPSVEALLADDEIDAVCIGTWPNTHRDYSIAALEAGKHVLCEARMCRNAREAEAMLAASTAQPDLVAQIVPAPFDFRLGPTIQRLIREGELGEVIETRVRMINGGGLDPSAPLHWRHSYDLSGKNTMMLGILNEMIQRWLGDTRRVVADSGIRVRSRTDAETEREVKIEIPDSIQIVSEMANGSRTLYDVSAVAAGNFGHPPGEVLVYGSEATLHWTFGDKARLAKHGEEPAELDPDVGTDRGWLVEQDFAASVRDGASVELTSFRDGVRYMRFIEAVWDSWHQARAIDVPSLEATDEEAARRTLLDEARG